MILLDTNVIVYAVKRSESKYKKICDWLEGNLDQLSICEVTKIELFNKDNLEEKERETIEKLLECIEIISPKDTKKFFDIQLELVGCRLGKLGFADALIAAHALENNLKLATYDAKFVKKIENIKGLELVTLPSLV